jgi:hypothetical protein
MTKINFDKVCVEWVDIQSCDDAWNSKESFDKLLPAFCTTIGYLYASNENFVKTFATFSHDVDSDTTDYGDCVVIPRGCVLSITKLEN